MMHSEEGLLLVRWGFLLAKHTHQFCDSLCCQKQDPKQEELSVSYSVNHIQTPFRGSELILRHQRNTCITMDSNFSCGVGFT